MSRMREAGLVSEKRILPIRLRIESMEEGLENIYKEVLRIRMQIGAIKCLLVELEEAER